MVNIFLMGPKHSGKTSVGKTLASLYSCEFADIDELIFKETGKTPRQLFVTDPAVFQKAEAEAMAALLKTDSACSVRSERCVIAAGGGIIDNAEAIAVLKNINAVTVYLNVSADCAWQRIINSPGGELPPFLKANSQAESREIHRALHERRAAAYIKLANIVINAEGKTKKEIAAEIIEITSKI